MIILGVILLIAGLVVGGLHILVAIGIAILVIGGALAVAGAMGHAIGGRRHYY